MAEQRVAIIGYGTEGVVSADYYRKQGYAVTICDQKTSLDIPEGYATQLGNAYLQGLDAFDIVVRTAGIPPRVILAENPSVQAKMTTAVNEFLRVCPTKNVIGVTGTKGKGTTSTLVARILEAAGKTVYLGGNIGRSPLEFYDNLKPSDWVVLELSSFQLIDVQHSPHIGVCLMVMPEHLNWHADMAEYIAAKSQLFEHQTSDDTAIYFAGNATSREIAGAGAGQKVPYYESPGAWVNGNMVTIDGQEVCTTDEIKLLGAHNLENICAAITAVWQAGVQDLQAIRSVVTSFSGLEHRLEFVRELDGIRYYDDSFGTTPETAIVALATFTEPKVLILGGSDKGASYDMLAQAVATHNVRRVILIGNTAQPRYPTAAPKIADALQAHGYNTVTSLVRDGGASMDEIVAAAREAAHSGDAVLLSTGTASFDMFSDYKARGNQFKQAVQALAAVRQ